MRRPVVLLLVVLAAACRPAVTPEPSPAASPTPGPGPVETPAPEDPEVRAVWVHLFDDTLKTRAGIAAMLDDVAAADVNTVIAQVARRHDAYYASEVLPPTPDPALEPGLDVLAELVDGARSRGLRLHAWISVAPTYHHAYDDLPHPPGWLWTEHGPRAPEGERWVTRDADGRWGEYLDPGVIAVREHAAAVAGEIAARYDVDAVHLDYVRYDGSRWGHHPAALARFRAETGLSAPAEPAWSDWRRAQSRAVIQAAREAVDAAGRGIGLSAAVIAREQGPSPGRPFEDTFPHREALQDWRSWMREGLVDAAFLMAYFREGVHADRFDTWSAFASELAHEVEGTVAVGVGAWLNPVEASLRQLRRAMALTNGAIVYSYQQNSATQPHGALLAELRGGAWHGPAG